jgi:putative DNA primase/helicase
MKERGAAYVRETIEAALTPKRNNVRGLTISEARTATTTAVGKAIDELLAPRDETARPPAIALKVSTGVGKTEAYARETIARMISGDLRTTTIGVPDNKLSAELLARIIAIRDEMGATFEIGTWRGREADNPEAINEKMCARPDVVRAVQRAGLDVQTFACKTPEGAKCPFYSTCAYQAQRRQRRRLTITNHATIFAKKAKGIPVPDLLVLDEGFWSQGLIGTGTKIMTPLDELQGAIRLTHEHGRDLFGDIAAAREADAMADLEPAREKLRHILATAPEGPLRREHIEGLTADACRAAAKAEGRRLVVPKMDPSMPGSEIMRRLEKAAPNAGCRRRAALFDAIADFIEAGADASGHVLIDRTEDGTPALRSLGRRPLGDGWAGAPALILDATLRPELVRPWFPDVRVADDIEAEAPHMKLVQHYSRSFAKSHFKDRDATGPWSADRKAVSRLWTWCKAEIQKTEGSALVVVQKAIEDAIRSDLKVPVHIDLAHHNAVAGRDTWRNVSTLISVGRTLPPPEAVEAIAMALGGEWLDPACLPTDAKSGDGRPRRWYAAAAHPVTDRAGNTITLTREHHPHPLAEAARAAICEDELVQIIGRCRGVNRTEADPVTVHILADLPLPVQVDEFCQWDPPGLDAAMLAEGAATESCEDAARWWPEIIRNAKALKDARHQRSVEFSYNILKYENSTHLARLSYQKPGTGQRPVAAIIDRRLIPDPEQWLRDRLGPVKVTFLDADAVATRKTRRKAAPPPPDIDVVEISTPAPDAPPEAVEIEAPEAQRLPTWEKADPAPEVPPPPYEGGTLPPDMAVQVQRRLRELGYRHADAAEAVGISRQQFTNAVNRRFGLSRDAAARLTAFMNRPPDVPTQPDFNL